MTTMILGLIVMWLYSEGVIGVNGLIFSGLFLIALAIDNHN